jgi:phage tail sheath protein FI
MAQVSFPGVYIQEVPSGARTITGVATSIAAFVGMAKQGPVNVPTTVLGFTDFARTFSEDISNGEMPDQVRQFFLNGGTQAIIMRIANGALKASDALKDGVGDSIVTLTAINDGQGSNSLRAAIDYNTASPETTFNLTIYQESLDARGNSTLTLLESHTNLSFDANDARFVEKVVNENSSVVTAAFNAVVGVPGTNSGITLAGTLIGGSTTAPVQNYPLFLTNLVTQKGGVGKFRLQIGDQIATVVLTAPSGGATFTEFDIGQAVNNAFPSLGDTLVVVLGSNVANGTQIFSISAPGFDIRASSGPDSDIAADLGLGVAQGGLEVGVLASFRPAPSGFVSDLGPGFANLLAFADASKTDWNNGATLALAGPQSFSFTADNVSFPKITTTTTTDTTMKTGTAIPGSPSTFSLRNVRQNLQAVADAININTTAWKAALQGVRLALTPNFGDALAGTGHQWAVTNMPPGIVPAAAGAFALFTANATGQPRSTVFIGGDDGQKPNPIDYDNAYTIIDQQVDLFNLLLLPKSAQDSGNDRAALWGPASVFCDQRRAFLLIDPRTSIDTVDKAVQEIKTLRIGTVIDHAAAYWPRLSVNPDGNPRFIDSSGSIAGIMSRIDGSRGVWKAPAGLEADVRGILGVTVKMSDPENGRINPEALNAIRVFPNGIVSWGARTMAGFDNSGDDDFKYVPVRRVEMFIEESLVRGLRFAVFEPNDEPLWAQLRLAVGGFMNNLFRQGAFQGATARDAYFVKADSETTTQNDINLGVVNVVVGFAPLKPAEFVVITIKQLAGQIQV